MRVVAQEKLRTQIARVNADVNEATQMLTSEEAARKVAAQTGTANGLMKQELEKSEMKLKEAAQRVKELEGMMFVEQVRATIFFLHLSYRRNAVTVIV